MSRMMGTYSVFVGHIHPDTKQGELRALFEACGDLVEAVILESASKGIYKFGFVRYTEPSAAFRAVGELHNWKLKGIDLVVQISKDTQTRLELEKVSNKTDTAASNVPPRLTQRLRNNMASRPASSRPNTFLKDTMYLNRIKENCTVLNMQQTDGQIDTGNLLDDIERSLPDRCPTLWGSLDDASTDFEHVSHKIMQSCLTMEDQGQEFGQKLSAEFMSALQTIMKEINKVVGNDQSEESEQREEGESVNSVEDSCKRDKTDYLQTKMKYVESPVKDNVDTEECLIHVDTVTNRLAERLNRTLVVDDQELSLGNGRPESPGQFQNDDLEKSLLNSSLSSEDTYDFCDPAILDYHLSKLKDTESAVTSPNQNQNLDNYTSERKNETNSSVLDMLFSKMINPEKAGNLVRSSSRESSMSEGSNEGNIDDSGVESDCLGAATGLGHKNTVVYGSCERDLRRLGQPNFWGVGRRRFVESVVECRVPEPKIKQKPFSLADYVHKSVGRGRGLWQSDVDKVQVNTGKR